jgi:hypothetical protein
MAHYALITDGIVTEVIVGIDETELIEGLDPETWYGNFKGQICKRTSYNASGGGFRKNYASVGYTYDAELDAFIAPKPENATGFDKKTCRWIVPKMEIPLETISE